MAAIDYSYIGALTEQVQLGNLTAFSELYASTYRKQYAFAYNYLQDEMLAQNALQETYILALKNIQSLNEPTLFVAWLNQINFRVCYNMQRGKDKQEELSFYEHDNSSFRNLSESKESTVSQSVWIDGVEFRINQVLNLPFTESQVILLKYHQKLTTSEIADILDISRSAVKRYTARGLSRLAQILQ